MVGLLFIAGGYYSAVNWKTGEENWTPGAQLVIVGGIGLAIYCVVGAIRPTKVTFVPPAILFTLSMVGIVFAGVAEWVRSL